MQVPSAISFPCRTMTKPWRKPWRNPFVAAVSSHASIQLRIALDETPCDSGEATAPNGVCARAPIKGDIATAKAIVISFMSA